MAGPGNSHKTFAHRSVEPSRRLGQCPESGTGFGELRKIPDPSKLKDYPFYPAAQGEFHVLAGRPAEATKHFETAMELASSKPQRNLFERKLKACRVVPLKSVVADDWR